jgi:hypothetical protein
MNKSYILKLSLANGEVAFSETRVVVERERERERERENCFN